MKTEGTEAGELSSNFSVSLVDKLMNWLDGWLVGWLVGCSDG